MLRNATIMALSLGMALTESALGVPTSPPAAPQVLAARLFERLSGVPLRSDDPRLARMAVLIDRGDLRAAANIATDDPHFFDVTLTSWALALANKAETPLAPFNDFAAMIAGVARDEADARTLLTGDFTYVGDPTLNLPAVGLDDNEHYAAIEARAIELKSILRRREPQRSGVSDAAGLLSSRAWGEAHLRDGTNRRAVQFAFQEFLCAPISSWRDASLDDYHVRRDVSRAPGGDPATYENLCRGCHAPMDAMGGAYASFDFQAGTVHYAGPMQVYPKMNKNAGHYPEGWMVVDDTWRNLLPVSQTAPDFGWRGPTEGAGLHAFGQMLADSRAFSRCLTKRAFAQVCRQTDSALSQSAVEHVAGNFESGGYKLKQLFADVAILPACLGTEASVPVGVGVKTFRQLNATYAKLTGIAATDPDIQAYYAGAKTRLPKLGQATEVSSPMLLTATALGSLYCHKMVAADASRPVAQRFTHKQVNFMLTADAALSPGVQASVVSDYARVFWQRPPQSEEESILTSVFAQALTEPHISTEQVLTLVCSTAAASLATLVN